MHTPLAQGDHGVDEKLPTGQQINGNTHELDTMRAAQKQPAATAAGDDHSTTTATGTTYPKDVIETVPICDRHESSDDDKTLHLTDTVKKATDSAKRKLYVHHRHRKNLTKQFSPGSAWDHLSLPWHTSNTTKKKKSMDHDSDPEAQAIHEHGQPPNIWQNFRIMLTTFPYWNMAFWSGWCYSIGSAMFIVDGAWSWVPQAWPETEFKGQTTYGVPLLFFFGACLYQVGGVMAYLEAVNDGSFAGAAMKKLLQGHQDIEKEFLDAKLHTFFGHIVPHHHHDDDAHEKEGHHSEKAVDQDETDWKTITKNNSPEEVYAEAKDRVDRRGGVDHGGVAQEGQVREYLTWRWWPTWHGLITYHVFELGYIACAIQLFGVTLYGVTSIVILPGIFDKLVPWQKLAAYWIPQVIASCCFLLASIMFTVMAQDKWYKPKWGAVSWWIGIWAQVGSVGFLLCAVFGLHSETYTWCEYQSSLSSMWGSLFYMLSGLFQWYEAININVGPVLAFPNNRTPILLRRSPK